MFHFLGIKAKSVCHTILLEPHMYHIAVNCCCRVLKGACIYMTMFVIILCIVHHV